MISDLNVDLNSVRLMRCFLKGHGTLRIWTVGEDIKSCEVGHLWSSDRDRVVNIVGTERTAEAGVFPPYGRMVANETRQEAKSNIETQSKHSSMS